MSNTTSNVTIQNNVTSNFTTPSPPFSSLRNLNEGVPGYLIFLIVMGLLSLTVSGIYFLCFWQKKKVRLYHGSYEEQVAKDRAIDQEKEGKKVNPKKLYSGVRKDFHLEAEEDLKAASGSPTGSPKPIASSPTTNAGSPGAWSPSPRRGPDREGPRKKIPTFRDLEAQRTINLSQPLLDSDEEDAML